jgi:hypothetical protein
VENVNVHASKTQESLYFIHYNYSVDIKFKFGALTPLEPRLGKKLIEPLTNLINSTSAMSLLYECINTVLAGKSLLTRH